MNEIKVNLPLYSVTIHITNQFLLEDILSIFTMFTNRCYNTTIKYKSINTVHDNHHSYLFRHQTAIFGDSTNKYRGDTMDCVLWFVFYCILSSVFVGQCTEYIKMNVMSNLIYSSHVCDICCIISHCGYLYLRHLRYSFISRI